MIFVTVGNGTQGFSRLLRAVDDAATARFFESERVFVQSGHTVFRSTWCENRDFLSPDEFDTFMRLASLIICHGGCGTLLHAVRLRKVPVVMPRRKQHGEIVNDHQLQLVHAFAAEGLVQPALEPADLIPAIVRSRGVRSPSPTQEGGRMVTLVRDAIRSLSGT